MLKAVKNDSLQMLEIYLQTEQGPKTLWLSPKERVLVPESYIGQQLKTLLTRRMVKITNAS